MTERDRKRSRLASAIIAEIKRLLAQGRLYQHEIAEAVGVNQGRVSEIKTGKRG